MVKIDDRAQRSECRITVGTKRRGCPARAVIAGLYTGTM